MDDVVNRMVNTTVISLALIFMAFTSSAKDLMPEAQQDALVKKYCVVLSQRRADDRRHVFRNTSTQLTPTLASPE